VVDFINVKAISFLNIFNIEDIGITVGCILLIIALLIFPQRKKDDAGEQQL
jgi:lipoprotein signal peptidase